MGDPNAGLARVFAGMSDGELLERWSGGCLSEAAIGLAGAEFLRRGVEVPDYVAWAPPPRPAAEDGPDSMEEVARSEWLGHLQVLRARLEGEGIASMIVNEHTNRMGPQFSNVAGGARLLVPSRRAAEAKVLIELLNAGTFALDEGEDPG